MVLRSIERIKSKIPGILHVVMFYNDGTVFQTTFPAEMNIPQIGKELATTLTHLHEVITLYDTKEKDYRKLIYETEHYIIMLLKLGEDSHLALLLDNTKAEEFKIGAVRQYLTQLEELIDMDQQDLEKFKQAEKLESETSTTQDGNSSHNRSVS